MRAQRQIMLFWGILAACGGDDQSTTTTMTVTTVPTTMSPTSDPSGDTSEPGDSSDSTDPTPTGDSVESSDTTPVEGAPVIVSLQTNVTKITAGESVLFTAVLTDPDGLDDIAGGTLSDQSGMIGFGPFVAAGQEGTFSISLSWDAVHQADPIEFEGMDLVRVFRAEFYDQAANKVSKDVNMTLTCAEGSACDGLCTDLMTTAEHCGSCAGVCDGGCQDGNCAPKWGECLNYKSGFDTCDAYCTSVGESCVEGGCEDGSTIRGYANTVLCADEVSYSTLSEPCDLAQPWTPGRLDVQCCCTDSP